MKPYYQDQFATIYHGDCLEIMSELPKADLVLTDPPYEMTACSWDDSIDLSRFWSLIQKTSDAAAVFTASQPFTSILVMSRLRAFKHEWIWSKNRSSNFLNAKVQPLKIHESVVVFCDGSPTYNPQITTGHAPVKLARRKANSSTVYNYHNASVNNAGSTDRYPKSILEIKCVDNISKERVHPTQKPVELMRYLVSTYSNHGQLVVDPFCGSGTTLVAAQSLGRMSIGIEREEKYCEIAAIRLRQKDLFLHSIATQNAGQSAIE